MRLCRSSAWRLVQRRIEERLGGADRSHGRGPSDVERQVRDGFSKLFLREAVVQRPPHVRSHLIRAAQGDERRHRDETAITLGQPWPLPNVAEKDVISELRQLGRKV